MPTKTSVLPIIMQLICMLASACAIRFLAFVKNSLAPSLVLPFSKCRNKSVAQTGSAHHSCGISVKFLMCQSAIFFDDMSDGITCSSPRWISRNDSLGGLNGEHIKDSMARRETLELAQTYYAIGKSAVRKRIAEMVKSIATKLDGE